MSENITTFEKVKSQTTEEYFNNNQFSIDAFNKKYASFTGETYVQAIKRVCDYVASAEDEPEKIKYWSQRWFDEIYNDWWYPAGSIMQGSGVNRKVSSANCFSRDTDFITDKGIRSFEDFSDGDNVFVMNNYGSFVPAVVRSFGNQRLYKLTFQRYTIKKEVYCTSNHIWRTSQKSGVIVEKETQDLSLLDEFPYIKRKWMPTAAGKSRFYCPIGFIHGYVFGDGDYDKSRNTCSIYLCGDSQELVKLFTGFNWNIQYRENQIEINYLPSYFKNEIPEFGRYNEEYILGFLIGYFAADGTVDKEGRSELSCANYKTLLKVKEIVESVGIYCSDFRLVRDKSPFDGNEEHKLYNMYIWKDCLFDSFFVKSNHKEHWEQYKNSLVKDKVKLNWKLVALEETDRIENVWCVQVPEDHNFTLSGGLNTGNCTTVSLGTISKDEEWDNLESIIRNTAYTVAKTAAYRQGLGVDFSRIRPVGTKVLNSSNESSGAIHWMKFIDSIGYYVGQKGRVPAMLFSLNCSHPDIEEFINVKSDKTKIQNANISVQCTDAFYNAVKDNKDWILKFEIPAIKKGQKVYIDVHSATKDSLYDEEKRNHYYIATHNRPGEKIEKTIKARKLLEMIAKGMLINAEPGIQNIDMARKYSNSDYVYDKNDEYDSRIISSNACCVVGETKILTNRGWIDIEEIHNNSKDGLEAISYNIGKEIFEFKPIVNSWQQRTDYTVILSIEGNGKTYEVECSADHPILTENRGYVKAELLTNKDRITTLEDRQHHILDSVRTKEESTLKKIEKHNIKKPLYDIEIQDNHNFVVNKGIVVKNSEQYLSRDSLCVLSSINAEKFSSIENEYEKELEKIGTSINRFLDNVNEMELRNKTYATPFQRMAIEKLRRTGAGVTNIAGWLFKKNCEYGSSDGNKAISHFVERYNYHLYKSSINLGKEKGNFGLFNKEKLEKSPFIQRMKKLGLEFDTLRNITCSSIAPSGTGSLMFRNTVMSYGVEPSFGMYYWKRTRITGKYEYYFCIPNVVINVFKNAGYPIPTESDTIKDTWEGKYGKPIAEFIEQNKDKVGVKFKKSTDVSPIDKLDLMSELMKSIDSSISVTYMLKEGSSWKDIYDFILLAYDKGVKSIAAFPDKKMYGIVSYIPFKELAIKLKKENIQIHNQNFTIDELKQLDQELDTVSLNTGAADNKLAKITADKRPKSLPCDVHHVKITKKLDKVRSFEYLVIVGLMEYDQPYEVFAIENGQLSKNYNRGEVIKHTRGKYDLVFADGTKVENITKGTTESEDALTRMTSISLRHGVPIEFVVDQLDKVEGDLYTFSKSIARALKKYLKDGIKVHGFCCPSCGRDDTITRQEGCISCACGYSKCG